MKLEQLKIGMKVIGSVMELNKRKVRTVVEIQPEGYLEWERGCKVKDKNGITSWEFFEYLKPFENNIKKI